jgi:hypothetical protein
MILKVDLQGAHCYEIGDEIWQESRIDAITAEAEMIASYAGAELLQSPDQAHRDALRDRIVREMTSALVSAGDHYTAPDGVVYSLLNAPAVDLLAGAGRLTEVSAHAPEPIVEEVLRFECLPLGSVGTRRAIVRWSDGTDGEGLAWYADELLVCEGDLIGKTKAQIRSLHFHRDRDWLQS